MFSINRFGTTVNIKLDNGLYIINNESATGKTRLAKLFKEYQKRNEPVASYSYDDKMLNIPIESILIPGKYKAIMIDRYDMYKGYGIDLIEECAKNSIVLMDCKHSDGLSDIDEWCHLELTQNTIEVDQ